MIKVHSLKGSKEQILLALSHIQGEITEAIVFVEEPAGITPDGRAEDIFAEMEAFAVRVGSAGDSRDAIYSPTADEIPKPLRKDIPQKVLRYAAKTIDPPAISDEVPETMPFVAEGE